VTALLEGLSRDLAKAIVYDPEGYAALRSEAALLLTHLPTPEQQERYAQLYRSVPTSSQYLTSHGTHGQVQLRVGAAAGPSWGHSAGEEVLIPKKQQEAIKMGGTKAAASGSGSGGELTGPQQFGGWLLQAAGLRRRNSAVGAEGSGSAASSSSGGMGGAPVVWLRRSASFGGAKQGDAAAAGTTNANCTHSSLNRYASAQLPY